MLGTMDAHTAARASSLRAFNRFYTRRIGVVGEQVLDSPYSLAQTRALWELAHGPGVTATALARTLALDAGYLSRLLAGLRRRGLVKAAADPADRRRRHLALSAAGRRALAPLERRSQQQMSALLAPLSETQQRDLLAAAGRIGRLLGDEPATPESPAATPAKVSAAAPAVTPPEKKAVPTLHLRAPGPGDIGWVIARHGALYAQEYGWDGRFEALVARIAADFIERFDPAREACWIAESGGDVDGAPGETGDGRLGCAFLVQARDEKTGKPEAGIAQLRMLLVEPAARGQGLGRKLVAECERFARERGYRRIRLWTNSVLLAARGIYKAAGYKLVARERHLSFGKRLVGETWELAL